MECVNLTGNLRKATTGAGHGHSANGIGCSPITQNSSEARATLQKSLAPRTPRFYSGFGNMTFRDGRCLRLVRSSGGDHQALTIQCGTSEANSIRDGLAASRPSGNHSMQAKNGRAPARMSGSGTMRAVAGVIFTETTGPICLSTFITLSRLLTGHCGRSRAISFCSARPVTNSFTRGGI